jgi:hypothetical protein
MTKDVTATGSTNLRPYLGLNGKVMEAPLAPGMRLLQQAEQVTREVAALRPEIALLDTELVEAPSGPVLVVTVQTPRRPDPQAVARFEALLRERLAHPDVRLIVRRVDSTDITSKGRILFGAAHFSTRTPEQRERQRVIEVTVRARIEAVPNLFVTAIDAVRSEPGWSVRAEVVGPRVPTPVEVRGIEKTAAASAGEPIALSLRASAEVVVTGVRYEALGYTRPNDASEQEGEGP